MTQVTPEKPQDDLLTALSATEKKGFFRGNRRRNLLIGGAALILIAIIAFASRGNGPSGQYVTEEAGLGNLVATVSATGTLQPTKSIDVGSEQSGTLATVQAQENDQVKKGQVLAELDLSKLKDAVVKSRASLESAKATVMQYVATVAETKATLARYKQVAQLSGGKVPSKTEMETAEANLLRAQANLASARASVSQAEANLKTDETNLSKGTIRAPVNGVILSRKVEPGQTVVASMSTPVLFTMAEDLTRMELQVKVDEADVSNVKLGQPATFTVSSWPGRTFPATIRRVGVGSTTTNDVVTYKTVLDVKNADFALRPGMTATATIETANRPNVLMVPNAALRFTPPKASDAQQQKKGGGFVSSLMPKPPAQKKEENTTTPVGGAQQVWVLENNVPRAISVQTGVTNGRYTEITGGDLKPGMAVITDYEELKK